MKQIKFFILGALFLIAGFLLGYGLSTQSRTAGPIPASSQTREQASMMIDTGSELLGFPELPVSEKDTVWSLLKTAAQEYEALSVQAEDYGDLGVLIQSINKYENGADKKYWQFWVNNKYADVAADAYPVGAGDSVMWKFTSSRFSEY